MNRLIICISLCILFVAGGCGTQKAENVTTNTAQQSSSVETTTENVSAKNDVAATDSGNKIDKAQPEVNNGTSEGSKSDNPSDKDNPVKDKKEDVPTPPIEPSSPEPNSSGDMPNPEQPKDIFLSDKRVWAMIGIIVSLCCVIGWLLYDRNKKSRINGNLAQGVNISGSNTIGTYPHSHNHSQSNADIEWKAGTLQNQGQRSEQQDSLFIAPINDKNAIKEKGLLAVVADGMGGLQDGAAISGIVRNTFAQSYAQQINIIDSRSFLYDTARNAELDVEKYIGQSGVNGGSTVVAVHIKGNELNYLSVGDSHIYILHEGKIKQINKEHSFAKVLKEKAARGEVDPQEPYINPQRNSLTAYIGMGSFQIIDRNENPIIIKPGMKILLCSDGVYNALGDDALIQALSVGDATACCRVLEANIIVQNIPNQDNFTGIVLEYTL